MRWARRASRPATCAEDLHERNTAQQRSAGNYLYYTVSGLMYPGTQRLYRKPLTGGAPAAVLNGVTDVRRNAQQGGAHMLGTTATGLVRIAQPDDASPSTSTHPLAGLRQALALQPVIIGPDRSTSTRRLGRRRYELTDHLGNVRVVLGDRKLSDFDPQNTPIPTHFSAEVMAYADYDPFGSLLPGRYAPGDQAGYRFGFQGQEKDDEIHDDPGTSYAFEYRMHDPRVGRFLSIDPLAAKYPHNSTYAFSENRVIDSNELEGLETIPGGQIVTSEDLLAPALLTMATESTITPATLWDTQVRYPTGGPSSEPGLLTEGLIGGVVFTESAIRNGASGFLLLGSALVSGAETFGRHAPIAIANDFSEQRLYPSENYTAPYTLGDNWLPVRRESLAGEKLSPTEGAEIVGAVLGAIGLRYSGFLPTTGSGAADKALEMGVKGGVNAGVTTGMRALDTPPPVVETDEQ